MDLNANFMLWQLNVSGLVWTFNFLPRRHNETCIWSIRMIRLTYHRCTLNLSLLAVIKVGVGVGMHIGTTYKYTKLIIKSQIIFTQTMEHIRAAMVGMLEWKVSCLLTVNLKS